MRLRGTTAAAALVAAGAAGTPAFDGARRPDPAPKADPALVKRGEYLVNEVARCGDCHTPRDARGRLDPTRHLQGAPLWFTPKVKAGEGEGRAPDITASGRAGRWTEARMVRLLTAGKPEPPMPAYRLTAEDAKAVAAYLRALPGKAGGGKGDAKGRDDGRDRGRDRRRDGGRDDD